MSNTTDPINPTNVIEQMDHDLSMSSVAIGWMYTIMWALGYYPQIYKNWKRKR